MHLKQAAPQPQVFLGQYTLLHKSRQVGSSAKQHNLTSEEGLGQVRLEAILVPAATKHYENIYHTLPATPSYVMSSRLSTCWPAGLQGSFSTSEVVLYAFRTSPPGLCPPAKPSLHRSPAKLPETLARVATAVALPQR